MRQNRLFTSFWKQYRTQMIHFVRLGVIGHIGRFQSSDAAIYPRSSKVIVKTNRGLEVGEVLSCDDQTALQEPDGVLLRGMTDSDLMLAERLERNRHAAYESCAALLAEKGSSSILLDVEHLFDGQGLYFYFLGETDPIAQSLTSELATAYDAEARFDQFASALDEGCGPGCGTPEAEGGACGSGGGCAGCAVAAACAK